MLIVRHKSRNSTANDVPDYCSICIAGKTLSASTSKASEEYEVELKEHKENGHKEAPSEDSPSKFHRRWEASSLWLFLLNLQSILQS